MKTIYNVSSTVRPQTIDINSSPDTKYIRINIVESVDEFNNVVFTYTEEQYSPEEFIHQRIFSVEKEQADLMYTLMENNII